MSQINFFDQNYEVLLADTEESKKIHFQLRYHVYCDELRFEDKNNFPNKSESDEWDTNAIHFIVRHKYTGQYLGALRLAQGAQRGFPLEKYSKLYKKPNENQYAYSMEISRLCVIKEARRFNSKSETIIDPKQKYYSRANINEYRPSNRELMWGMIRAAALYSHNIGVIKWYILVAPALALTIQKAGFSMKKIGHACQLRGERTPYILNVDQVLSNSLWLHDYQNGYASYAKLEETKDGIRLIA